MERDDIFRQAVRRAREKDYKAARALLRNLLFQYPEDINALLLYSLVAETEKGAIEALKQILQIDPDHDIAFARLAKLKPAPPKKPLEHYAPIPPAPRVRLEDYVIQEANLEAAPKLSETQKTSVPVQRQKNSLRAEENRLPRKKKRRVDPILWGLTLIVVLCMLVAIVQAVIVLLEIGI